MTRKSAPSRLRNLIRAWFIFGPGELIGVGLRWKCVAVADPESSLSKIRLQNKVGCNFGYLFIYFFFPRERCFVASPVWSVNITPQPECALKSLSTQIQGFLLSAFVFVNTVSLLLRSSEGRFPNQAVEQSRCLLEGKYGFWRSIKKKQEFKGQRDFSAPFKFPPVASVRKSESTTLKSALLFVFFFTKTLTNKS